MPRPRSPAAAAIRSALLDSYTRTLVVDRQFDQIAGHVTADSHANRVVIAGLHEGKLVIVPTWRLEDAISAATGRRIELPGPEYVVDAAGGYEPAP